MSLVLFLVVALGVMSSGSWTQPMSPLPDGVRGILVLVAAVAAANLESARVRKRYGGPAGLRRTVWPGTLRSTIGSTVIVGIFLAQALLLPARPPIWMVCVALSATVVGVGLVLGYGVHLARFLGRTSMLDLRVQGVDVGVDAVQVLDVREANAVAFPLLGEIAITKPALELLDRDELEAVMRHEVDHLREPRWQARLRAVPMLFMLAMGWWHPILTRFGGWPVLALYVLFLLSAMVLRKVTRRAERHADHRASGGASPAYARGLEKLHEWNLGRAVNMKRSTHPGLYERMVAAGVTPAWSQPKPAAPSPLLFLILACLGVAFAIALVQQPYRTSADRASALRQLARGGHDAQALLDLGRLEHYERHDEAALVFLRCSSAVDRHSPLANAEAAIVLASLGRCAEARAELDEARRRDVRVRDDFATDDLVKAAISAVARCR
jgi:hypothetical protein